MSFSGLLAAAPECFVCLRYWGAGGSVLLAVIVFTSLMLLFKPCITRAWSSLLWAQVIPLNETELRPNLLHLLTNLLALLGFGLFILLPQ